MFVKPSTFMPILRQSACVAYSMALYMCDSYWHNIPPFISVLTHCEAFSFWHGDRRPIRALLGFWQCWWPKMLTKLTGRDVSFLLEAIISQGLYWSSPPPPHEIHQLSTLVSPLCLYGLFLSGSFLKGLRREERSATPLTAAISFIPSLSSPWRWVLSHCICPSSRQGSFHGIIMARSLADFLPHCLCSSGSRSLACWRIFCPLSATHAQATSPLAARCLLLWQKKKK